MSILKSAKEIRDQDTGYIESLENYFSVEIESSVDAIDFMLDMLDEYEFKDADGVLDIRKRSND
jgi:hypothetical protein